MAYANGYTYRATFTVDQVGSNLTQFPILISGTYADLAHTGHSGKVTSTSGYDIAFTTDSAGGTLVYPEIESYNHETGAVVLWVAFNLSGSATTTIYCFYGNSSITTSQFSENAVWDSNFEGVWHLSEAITGASQTAYDSTDSSLDGNTTGTWVATPSVTGQIAKALEFDGASYGSQIEISGGSYSGMDGQYLTISAWVKPDGFPGGYNRVMDRIYAGQFVASINNGAMCLGVSTSGTSIGWTTALTPDSTVSTGSWQHIAFVYDGSYGRAYLNGSATGTPVSGSGTLAASTANIAIGGRTDSSNRRWDGVLDEVRLSKSARSADWITAEYASQNDPSSFYSTSNWNTEAAGGSVPIFMRQYRQRWA